MAEKKKKHRVKEMHVKAAASGGYIMKHPNAEGSMQHENPDFQHVMPDMGAAQQHMQQHMEPDEDEGGGAAGG